MVAIPSRFALQQITQKEQASQDLEALLACHGEGLSAADSNEAFNLLLDFAEERSLGEKRVSALFSEAWRRHKISGGTWRCWLRERRVFGY
jgi:hypothetical protein